MFDWWFSNESLKYELSLCDFSLGSQNHSSDSNKASEELTSYLKCNM